MTRFDADSQWLASYTMILAGIRASFAMFNGAWKGVMRSPVGWHDRTPVGDSMAIPYRNAPLTDL